MTIELQPRGPAGVDGLSLYADIRSPQTNEGRDGETWVNAQTGAVLKKVSGAWKGIGSVRGPAGQPGDAGVAGRTIISGTEEPPSTLGRVGDVYLRDTPFGPAIYGPKTTGGWPAGEPLIGSLFGSVPPTATIGLDGQSYVDTVNFKAYGAKTAGVWPAGVSFAGAIANWTGGAYAAGTTYAKNDGVSYNGGSYVSLQNSNVGHQPNSSPSWWQLVAAQGAAGTSGLLRSQVAAMTIALSGA